MAPEVSAMREIPPLRDSDPRFIGGYELLGRIGQGGQGVVYLSVDQQGRKVAVKVFPATSDAETESRFLKEVAAARRVARFCTAQVLNAGIDQGLPYIVSEYIDGPSLLAAVRQEGPRTGGALDRVAVATATAIAAIHDAGLIHRDFKPGNVILGPDGPVVIDFGLAVVPGMTTQRSRPVAMGTPAFMAPEQLAGGRVTAAADLWSWAVSLVFVATGELPFSADHPAAMAFAIAHGAPSIGAVPEPLKSIVLRCLDKDPARRPTAQDILAEFVARGLSLPDGHPGVVRATPRRSRFDRVLRHARSRRVRLVAAVAVLSVAALLAGLITMAPGGPPARPGPAPKLTSARLPRYGSLLPGTRTTLLLRPSDPLRLLWYVTSEGAGTYLLNPTTGHFRRVANIVQGNPTGNSFGVAPDGLVKVIYGSTSVTFVNLMNGRSRTTATLPHAPDVTYVGAGSQPSFSPTGRYLAIADGRLPGKARVIVVDTESLKFLVLKLPARDYVGGDPLWADSTHIITQISPTVAGVFDLDGRLVRRLRLGGWTYGFFDSGFGRLLYDCPRVGQAIVPPKVCVMDVATGRILARLSTGPRGEGISGLYDQGHTYGWRSNKLVVRNFSGQIVNIIAIVHAARNFPELFFAHTR